MSIESQTNYWMHIANDLKTFVFTPSEQAQVKADLVKLIIETQNQRILFELFDIIARARRTYLK